LKTGIEKASFISKATRIPMKTTSINIPYIQDDQIGIHEAATSTSFRILGRVNEGVVLAVANVTGIAELSAARVAAGSPGIAGNCFVISINTVATAAVSGCYYHNQSAHNSTVAWKSLLSVPN